MLPIRFLHGQVTVVPFLNIIYPGGDTFKTVQISCFFWNFYPRMDLASNNYYCLIGEFLFPHWKLGILELCFKGELSLFPHLYIYTIIFIIMTSWLFIFLGYNPILLLFILFLKLFHLWLLGVVLGKLLYLFDIISSFFEHFFFSLAPQDATGSSCIFHSLAYFFNMKMVLETKI